jgi:Putative zinc-finger
MTGDIHMLLGSYVLGGLSAEDRRAFDEHLEDCPRCRAELAEAAPLPALLRKVPGVPSMPISQPAAGPSLSTLLDAARARRKRQMATRWVAAAAAVLIAFGGGAAVITVTQHQSAATAVSKDPFQNGELDRDETDEGRLIALRATPGQTASGEIGLKTKVWGTSIWLKLANMPKAGIYTLWATDDHGRTELAATWGATPSGRCVLDGATSIATKHLSKVSVLAPDQSVVLVAPV